MVSFLVHKRTAVVFTLLTPCTIAAFVCSILLGSKNTSPLDVLKTMLGLGTAENGVVIGTLRLHRAVVAVLVGAALSVSGSILQGVVRNPLASPDSIGITWGASFAAVAFITYLAGTVSIRWLPEAAFVGPDWCRSSCMRRRGRKG
jgi:iron complex transport system permease protein